MADRGTGSVFHPMVADRQLSWSAGDRVVFPWEKDGWLHLYSVAVEGGAPTLLTPGNFEVEFVSHSADGKEMIYGSNQDDIDRRHIWRVSAASGPPRAVTSGQGLEWTPALLSNGVHTLVPPHVAAGTRVVVMTDDGSYVERAKD